MQHAVYPLQPRVIAMSFDFRLRQRGRSLFVEKYNTFTFRGSTGEMRQMVKTSDSWESRDIEYSFPFGNAYRLSHESQL